LQQAGSDSGQGAEISALGTTGKPVMGLFIRDWPGLEPCLDSLASLADHMMSQGWEVVFIPMHYPEDLAPVRAAARRMKFTPVIIEEGLGFRGLTKVISSLDLVVGMRLHALIIALS
jgi:polysaccharide pyruvyl transferase WcaK-like protein